MAKELLTVTTKCQIPQPPSRRIRRERLLDILRIGPDVRLVLVCAPAGSGKTTLLGEWAREQRDPVAWLSLDRFDNSVFRFWNHVVSSVDAAVSGFRKRMEPALAEFGSGGQYEFLFHFINELSRIGAALAIVLDDYHQIENKDIHDMIAYALERLPPAVRLVAASRAEPPLPLPRLMARGQLLRIGGEELNFTEEEGLEYCRLLSPELPIPRIRVLLRRAEGWVAGVKLSLLSSLSGGGGGWPDAEAPSSRAISDYLFSEVFASLHASDREFLLYTSILNVLTAPLCEAVTGIAECGAILERLERANLFVQEIGRKEGWYRYHHLFAEFLQSELQRRGGDAKMRSLHARAGEWLACNGEEAEAVEHYLAGGCYEQAVPLLERLLPGMIDKEWETMLRWLSAVPLERLEESPDLLLACAFFATAFGNRPQADRLIDRCETLFGAGDASEEPEARQRIASLYLVKSLYAVDFLYDYDRAIELMRLCVRHAPGGLPLQDIEINPGEASVLRAFQRTNSDFAVLERFFREMLALWSPVDRSVFTGFFYAGFAELEYERNDLEEAERLAEAASEIALAQRSSKLLGPVAVLQSKLHLARGSAENARGELDQGERLLRMWRSGYWNDVIAAQRLRMFMSSMPGDHERFERELTAWTDRHLLLRAEEMRPYPYFLAMTTIQALAWLGRFREALDWLDELKAKAADDRRTGELQELLLLEALCLWRSHRKELAARRLMQSLKLAEPNGSVRPAAEYPELLGLLDELIRMARNHYFRESEAASLVFLVKVQRLMAPEREESPAAPAKAHMLTRKEREVLELLATGMPNRVIAAQLGISVGTVKTHINRIYEKLMVHDRWQAIQRAKQLFDL